MGLHKPNKAVTTKEAFQLYSLDEFWYLANTLKYVSLNTTQMLQLTDLWNSGNMKNSED